MLSGKNQAGTQPYAYGSLLQAATYGLAIPNGWGLTISPFLATWTANLRQSGSTKKFKQLKKGGPPTYAENITFLLGKAPIVGVNTMWNNSTAQAVTYTSQTFTGAGPWTITDAHFYAVIAVTVTETYAATFNDYGSAGPVTESGSYEVPLWNELFTGPDPIRNSGYRNYPYCYRWNPTYGATVRADAADIFSGKTVTVYYAKLTSATNFQTPLARNRMHFEPVLGDGDEYNGFTAQQILYPMFAGAGSASIDLGTGGVIPQLQGEVQFKWGIYPAGDADFVDMIEDIFKSGLAQAAIGAATTTPPAYTQIEHGLSGYNFPGCVQMKCLTAASSASLGPIAYNLAVTKGNFLVVIAVTNGSGGGALSIADSGGNSWTAVIGGSPHYQVWYAQANASGVLNVTVSGQGNQWGTTLIEIAGVDTFDSVAIGSNGTAAVTTTNQQGFPEYLLSVALYPGSAFTQSEIPLWTLLTPANTYGQQPANGYSIQERRSSYPQSVSASVSPAGLAASLVLAFKATNPPSYPNPVGDFLDFPSLEQVRLQCRANGLWGSMSMSSQQAASAYLDKLYQAADAAPVFLGFKLYSYPYSEVSQAGNGAIYRAATRNGPIASLSTETGDFIGKSNSALIEFKSAPRVGQPNVIQLQCLNRASNYNPATIAQPDQGSIAIYGIRKADPVQNNAIQDVSVGRKILGIQVRKLQYGGDGYTFEIPAKWALLSPMDLILVSDPLADLVNVPVRLTSVTEQSPNSTLECEAEAFVFGMYDPSPLAADAPAPFNPAVAVSAGNVNCPIIIQPTSQLQGFNNLPEIWMAISSGSGNYGGAQVYVSTDGGSSYSAFGDPVMGSAITGNVTTDWPAAASPDTTNDLLVDLTESLGTLQSYAVATQDGYQYPCVVTSGATSNAGINTTGIVSISSGDPLGITSVGLLYTLPTIPTLPCGAVITGIYPTIILNSNGDVLATAAAAAGAASGMTPVSGGSSFASYTGPQASTQYSGPSIGTSIATLIGQGISMGLGLSNAGAIGSSLGATAVGWGIVYTSGNPTIDPTIPPPITIPAGSGLAWAIPLLATGGFIGTPGGNTIDIKSTAGTPGFSGGYGYELMTYAVATLTSANHYTLKATGGGTNHLNRGVFGAPQQGQGCDHQVGSRFAFLNPNGIGILKQPLPNSWVGKLVYFKICSFNNYGAAAQSLSDVTAVPFMPTAAPSYSGGAAGVQIFQVNGA